jgi:hypothetical protein
MKEALHSSNQMKFGAKKKGVIIVDNFVDKRILIPGNPPLNSWHRGKPAEKPRFFSFKINDLEKRS